MRKIVCFLMLLAVSCVWNVAGAQQPDCPVQTIDGVQYYIYTVEKSEGLFRISKKFNVSQDAIKEANPDIKTGDLKLGQVLRIPVAAATPAALPNDSNFIVHVIAPKETLYGLSRQYDVSMDELVKYNPELTKSMPIGGSLLIPRKKTAVPAVTLPVENQLPKQDTVAAVTTPQPVGQDTLAGKELAPFVSPADTLQMPAIRIAYLLPFMLDAVELDPSVDKFVEFYEGALLAINDAKNKGIRLEINTYDTEKNEIRIQTVLNNPELKNMDLIIGPAYPAQVKHISKFAFENRINTLIPFTSDIADISINPYLFQFNSFATAQIDEIMSSVGALQTDLAVLYIKLPAETAGASTVSVPSVLRSANVTYKELELTPERADTLQYFLTPNKRNLLVFNTEKFNSVQGIMPELEKLKTRFPIEIIGHYAWSAYPDEIPVPMYYTSLFLPEPNATLYAGYARQFNQFFGHGISGTCPRYDLLGYDLTMFFIDQIATYGAAGMRQHISAAKHVGLITAPEFEQPNELCGFTNKHVYLLRKDARGTQIIK